MKLNSIMQRIYIVHFEPLKERKAQIEESLKRIDGVPVSYQIMNEQSDKYALDSFSTNFSSSPKRNISPQELAVSLAHLEIYRDILNRGHKTSLVLEDDAILDEVFFDNIEVALNESQQFDFTFLSSCCNLHVPKVRSGLLQPSSTSRSVCGYIVRSNCLEKVITACVPLIDVIDWQLNHIRHDLELRYAWSEPAIIFQGSEKEYNSNLEHIRKNRK